ncbi:MAG: TolC family protein [Sphingobacterium sp.]
MMRNRFVWGLLALNMLFFVSQTIAQTVIDPLVKDVIHTTFQTNKDIILKTYDVDKTNLEADGVKTNKLPHVSATGLYGYIHSNGSLDLPTVDLPLLGQSLFSGVTDFRMNTQAAYVGVSVRQVIFSGLQIPNGQRALKQKALAQQYLVDAGKEEIAKDLAATFDQIMLLEQVDKLIQDSEKRLQKEQLKVNKGIDNGLAIPYDRDKLKLALLELEQKKMELAGNRDLLVKKIQQLSGLTSTQVEQIRYELSPVFLSLDSTQVQDRLELKALEASGKAYDYLLKKERGGVLPTVFAFGSANYLNMHNTSLTVKDQPVIGDLDLSSNYLKGRPNLMIGVGLKWDIYSGGAHKNKLRQAELDQSINATKRADADQKLALLLAKNKVSYQTANQKLNVSEQQIVVASNNLKMASRQLEAGLIDVTELLASENEWYKVSLSYFSNIMEQRSAVLELLHASGNLLSVINE